MPVDPLKQPDVIDPDQDLPRDEDPEVYQEERRQPTPIDPPVSSNDEDDDAEEIDENAA